MNRSLLFSSLLLSTACAAQDTHSYLFNAPYGVRDLYPLDLGGGNSFFALDHNFGYDSSYVDMTWTGPDRNVTAALSFRLPLAFGYLNSAARVDDGVIVCGALPSLFSPGPYGPYFIKADDTGAVEWSQGVSFPSEHNQQATALVSHGSTFSAYSTGGGDGSDTIYLYHGDLAGNFTARTITTNEGAGANVTGATAVDALEEDIVCGQGSLFTDVDNMMVLLMRTGSAGAQWINLYDLGGTGGLGQLERIQSVEQLADGNFLATGYLTDGPFVSGMAMKVTPSGSVIWCRKYANAEGALLLQRSIELPDHSLLLSGEDGTYTAMVLKVQANGDLLLAQRADLGAAYVMARMYRNDAGTLTMTTPAYLIELDDAGNGCGLSPFLWVTDGTITPVVHTKSPINTTVPLTMVDLTRSPRTNSTGWTFSCSYAGITEHPMTARMVKMNPNPTTGRLRFNDDAPVRVGERVLVRSAIGNVVYDGPYDGEIDISGLASGVYQVQAPLSLVQAMVVKQ